MIEAYAFLAAFTVQILVMSVLQPAWLTRYARAQATTFPAERFAQQYPGIDFSLTLERYLTRYRVLNTGIAVLGVLLLGWLFSYMRRPNWDDGPVEALVGVYFMMQALPLGLFALLGLKYSMVLKHSLLERKRTAVLQRRGLFDFVSPFSVFLAVLSYFLFVAYVLYIEQNPFQGFDGYITIGAITLVSVSWPISRRRADQKRTGSAPTGDWLRRTRSNSSVAPCPATDRTFAQLHRSQRQ